MLKVTTSWQDGHEVFLVKEEIEKDVYTGEFDKFKSFVGSGIKLMKKPSGLVPKIDAARIKELSDKIANHKEGEAIY